MQIVRFNNCLNREEKLYGLSYYGVIASGGVSSIVWLKLGMTFGLMIMPVAYGICSYWARKWHEGILQRQCYNSLPAASKMLCDNLPASYIKCIV